MKKYADGGNASRNKEIAQTILQQLGGAGRLVAMTGAYNFIAIDYGVSFRIKNPRANFIKITLTPMDLYDLEIGRVRGTTYKVIAKHEGVYNDMLKPLIEKATGMYLSLFAKGGAMENRYADGGMVESTDTLTLIFEGKQFPYDVKLVDGEFEDLDLNIKRGTPLYNWLSAEFDEWLQNSPNSETEEMYYGEERIYDKKGAIMDAMNIIYEDVSNQYPKKHTFNLDNYEIPYADSWDYYKRGGKVKGYAKGGAMKKHSVKYDKQSEMWIVINPQGQKVGNEFLNKHHAQFLAKQMDKGFKGTYSRFAKGGMTEHGLKVNDTIKGGKQIGTTIKVHNPNYGDARVDLDKGKRTELEYNRKTKKYEEKMARGGLMGKLKSTASNLGKSVKSGYSKGKQYAKDKLHQKKKDIALDVIYETKEKLAKGRDEMMATEKAYKVVDKRYSKGGGLQNKMAKGGILKEDDYVWNAVGKKLVVDKVTDTEYYLVGFGGFSAMPFLKSKVDKYIEEGQWTLKPPKYAKGGGVDMKLNTENAKSFNASLKKAFKEGGMNGVKVRIINSYKFPNCWVEVWFPNGTGEFSNDFRLRVFDASGFKRESLLNASDVSYGNIQKHSISAKVWEWEKVFNNEMAKGGAVDSVGSKAKNKFAEELGIASSRLNKFKFDGTDSMSALYKVVVSAKKSDSGLDENLIESKYEQAREDAKHHSMNISTKGKMAQGGAIGGFNYSIGGL